MAAQCESKDTKGLLPHVTTANAARDLDRIREALGEERTSYLGYSYGTSLGAAYASMFPERSDRIVLDSVIGDTHLDPEGMRRYALGMEQTFPDFARWAAARHESYGLGRTPAQVRRSYLDLAARLDEKPVAGVNGVQFRQLVFAFLYKETRYPQLAQQWQALENGDAAGVRAAAPPEPSAADTPAGQTSW
ncbi:alpha/beta fold hydrolase [Streptomyces californicus]